MIKSCFYCKISWGGKCSFTRLAFNLLSGTSLGGPDADSAQGNLLRTFPQTSSLVLRAREREAERHTTLLLSSRPETKVPWARIWQ